MQRIKTFLLAGVTALAAVLAHSATASAQSPPQIFKGAPPSAWSFDGLFVSLSAGGTLTHGSMGQSGNDPYTETQQYFSSGVLYETDLTTSTYNTSSNSSGNGAGAVFTFSGGYNVVLWNNWLVGVQPEASWNLSKTRLTGTSSSTSSYTTTQTFPLPPGTPSTQTYSSSGSQQDTLKNDWTVSLLARGGYVLNNDWLFYGLLGWSWGGFDLDEGDQVFVMNGFTYGGGVEKNFGWLRAFVQVKAINYGNVNLSNSNAGVSTQTYLSGPFVTSNSVTNYSGGNRTSISADVVAVTGGITIPLWHP